MQALSPPNFNPIGQTPNSVTFDLSRLPWIIFSCFFMCFPWGKLCPHPISTQLDKRLNRWPLTSDDLESIFYAFPFMQALSPQNFGPIGQSLKFSQKRLPRWPPSSDNFLRCAMTLPGSRATSDPNLSASPAHINAWIPENEIGYKHTHTHRPPHTHFCQIRYRWCFICNLEQGVC